MIHLIQKVNWTSIINWKNVGRKNGEIDPTFTTNQWISIPRWKNEEIYPTFNTNQWISIPRWKWFLEPCHMENGF